MQVETESFVAARWAIPSAAFRVRLQPLQGGLESAVARAHVSVDPEWAAVPARFVVKQLEPGSRREADVYRVLWRHFDRPPAARILGVQRSDTIDYLFLEDLQPAAAWPWADAMLAAEVCRELARLHSASELPRDVFGWDYDAELAHSAHSTLQLALAARRHDGSRIWQRLGDLRRIVNALPELRSHLRRTGQTVIHGDVHPGNVILKRDGGPPRVALIDWGRARIGSPLEDVSSWLHSLGCWEPEARRRHDTLLRVYLESRGLTGALTPSMRSAYWLAAVSNGLSGAIRYHLAVLSSRDVSEASRYHSGCALPAWERVVRQAASLLRTSSADRRPGAGWESRPPTRSPSR